MANNNGAEKMTKVTFITKTGHEVVETYSDVPHANGFVPDHRLRAMALGWSVKSVERAKGGAA
jgi:hypothetical protein